MAAGRGVRAVPYSRHLPKVLFEVDGVSLLERNIKIMSELMKLNEIILIISYMNEIIEDKIKDISKDIKAEIIIKRIDDNFLNLGLLGGIASLTDIQIQLQDEFIMTLGDEFFLNPDHDKMLKMIRNTPDHHISCMIKKVYDPKDCLGNYGVVKQDDTLIELNEKPEKIYDYFGLGVLSLTKKVVEDALSETKKESPRNFINLLNDYVINPGVKAFETKSNYVNINSPTDLFLARKAVHITKFSSYKSSVIIPSWNEAESIGFVVKDFLSYCDEVIVMDNESEDGTAHIAEQAGAVVFSQPLKGYGDAIRKGLEKAKGDIFILSEADGTFRGEDIEKFTPFLMSSDAVVGTRTYWQFIEYGANMGLPLRIGNIFFGLIVTFLWYNRGSRFTDVGCTFRVMWKSTYHQIRDRLVGIGPELSPELTIEMLNSFLRVIEIPIPYHARVLGKSKFSGSIFHTMKTALLMLRIIISKRIEGWLYNIKNLFNV
jgi:NDP-sugar pyrophosphorylase family protein